MKQRYECDFCGCVYSHRRMALICELFRPLGEAKYQVGDTVRFDTRYETNQKDKIVEVKTVPSAFNNGGQLARAYVERPSLFEGLENDDRVTMHEYCYRLADYWQFGKDESAEWIWEADIKQRID